MRLATVLVALCVLPTLFAQPWMQTSLTPAERAEALLKQMLLDEKISMLHGVDGPYVGNVAPNTRLNIPSLNLNDGPQGFRDDAHPGTTTSFPSALTIAATFDPNMALAWGAAMGEEFFNKGANVQLGPGMCLARVPVNGRNFEYLAGEEPVLGAAMAAASITGIQSQGVIANAKHWVNNNQETNRGDVSADVDERTRFELYYPAFAAAVEAGVGSFMCSYNKINSVWSCENPETLAQDLKSGYGLNFTQGWVMSDWGATHSTSINQGLDQEMPGGDFMGAALKAAVQAGTVSEATIDASVLRVLTPMFQFGLFDTPNNNTLSNNVTSLAHNTLARTLSANSHVLLKNDNDILPLFGMGNRLYSGNVSIAVFGTVGDATPISGGEGSGSVVPPYVVTPFQALRQRFGIGASHVSCNPANYLTGTDFYQPGNPAVTATSASDCCAQCSKQFNCNYWSYQVHENMCWLKYSNEGQTPNSDVISGTCYAPAPAQDTWQCNGAVCLAYDDGSDMDRASVLANSATIAIVVVGAVSCEGIDRSNLQLGLNQENLISVVSSAIGPDRTIVVASVPGAILTDWRNEVAAILINFMPGQEVGNALLDVLLGDFNPAARLPLTFPNIENEVGFTPDMYPGVNLQASYLEELLVGYRWYNAKQVTPAYPFGHGLSYTQFEYSNLSVSSSTSFPVIARVQVKNAGVVAGQEVAQFYVSYPPASGEPPVQMKGFVKTSVLQPGASTQVSVSLTPRDLSTWQSSIHGWQLEHGTFTLSVGASVADLRLFTTFTV